jgi:hypothetical protein
MKNHPLSFVRFAASIAALTALPGVCRALPYFGTFTQTIHTSTVDGVYAGVQYYGYYTYESDTMDGIFATTYWPVNQTLNGYIFVPFAKELEIASEPKPEGIDPYWSTLRLTSQAGIITIENGQVTNFHWSHEIGGFYMSASLSGFMAISFYDYPYQGPYDPPTVSGSIKFTGGPRVPEPASSVGMLALGFLCLGLIARRFLC